MQLLLSSSSILMVAPAPVTHPPRCEESVPLLDVAVLCLITYMTYTRIAFCWRSVLGHMYLLFIVAWAYAETHGLLRPDTSLALRWVNGGLCALNMAMQLQAV